MPTPFTVNLGALARIILTPVAIAGALQTSHAEVAPHANPSAIPSSPDTGTVHPNILLKNAGYRFTPAVLAAYVDHQKELMRTKLKAAGKTVPDDFLQWVDSDGVLRSTIYGSPDPTGVMLMMVSLAQDVGEPRFKRYRNWLLAAAVKNAGHGMQANIAPRPPLKLVIPGDPARRSSW